MVTWLKQYIVYMYFFGSLHIFLILSFRELRFVISFSSNLCTWWLPRCFLLAHWDSDKMLCRKMIESILRRLGAVSKGGEQVYKEDYQNKVRFDEP